MGLRFQSKGNAYIHIKHAFVKIYLEVSYKSNNHKARDEVAACRLELFVCVWQTRETRQLYEVLRQCDMCRRQPEPGGCPTTP